MKTIVASDDEQPRWEDQTAKYRANYRRCINAVVNTVASPLAKVHGVLTSTKLSRKTY